MLRLNLYHKDIHSTPQDIPQDAGQDTSRDINEGKQALMKLRGAEKPKRYDKLFGS